MGARTSAVGPAGAVAVARRAAAVDRAAGRAVLVQARGEPLEDRQGERGGLAGAGRRLGEQVAAREQRRDRRGLDGRGLLVAERGERLEQPAVEAEGGEAEPGAGSVASAPGSVASASGESGGASSPGS